MRSLLTIILAASTGLTAESSEGYYRFPAIHGRTVVFTAEGDLWKVPLAGGTAVRLTSHLEVESRARFSPDGKTIAFSAAYEGPTEIYTMPIRGGQPTRLTWEGQSGSSSPYPVSWKSATELLYATRYFARRDAFQIAVLDTKTHTTSVIPLEQASDGVYGADETLYFTRLPRQSSHARRYRGGYIENLWKFSGGTAGAAGTAEAEPLTADYAGTSRSPMLWKDRLYFASDRDGTMNVWSMKTDGTDLQQHTHETDFEVLSPHLQRGRIVYQRGADLWCYDIDSDQSRKLKIRLASDFDQKRVRWLENPLDHLSDYQISADGDHVALTVRGRGFVVPVKPGRLIRLPQKADTRYRSVAFLPGTNDVYFLSDESGETEFWSTPANGAAGKARQITSDGSVLRYNGQVSPDGSQVAYTDRDQILWLLQVATGKSRKVTQSMEGSSFDSPDLAWSADSRWLAYADEGTNGVTRIFVYDTQAPDVAPVPVTTDRLNSFQPGFSADGKWLYFLSDRTFRSVQGSPWGARAPEAYLDRTTSLFALDLIGGQRSPFQPDDELFPKDDPDSDDDTQRESKEAGGEGAKGDDDADTGSDAEESDAGSKKQQAVYELTQLSGRLHRVPLEAGNYSNLTVAKSHVYFTETPLGLNRSRHLNAFPLTSDPKEQKVVRIASDMGSYRLSADRSHIVLLDDSRPHVFAANGRKPNLSEAKLNLSGLQIGVAPAEEWRQMFFDAWRLHRDYFYDPNMHKVDWLAVRQRHEALLPRVCSRAELDDLIAMMVSELSAMHTNIRGGDTREDTTGAWFGFLGATLQRDVKAGGYRVQHIYRNDPDYPEELAPLSRPGIDIRAGDVITSIDGTPVLSVTDARQLLLNKANRPVLVERTRKGQAEPHKYLVRPLSRTDFRNLKLSEWEYTRRLHTEEKSAGSIGYFHMRAMSGSNFSEFVKGFYPVFNRQGLIIDMRQNYGGNIDSWILSRLMRKAWMYWQARTGNPYANMQYAFNGHMVVLIDGYTISDGEAFSEGFRRLGLGPLIGTKTWGGGIWLRSSNGLMDGGLARSPEFGVFSPEGEWIIEGTGVLPDIEVDNPPHSTFLGQDAQLEAAIDYLKKKIAEDPRPVPAAPDYPNKSGR